MKLNMKRRSWIIRFFDWIFGYKPKEETISRDEAVKRLFGEPHWKKEWIEDMKENGITHGTYNNMTYNNIHASPPCIDAAVDDFIKDNNFN